MNYVEGVIKKISEEGVFCRARLEGSDKFEEVIVMECYITIKKKNGDELILKCDKGLTFNMKINDKKYILYDFQGIKEIHSNKDYLSKKGFV